MGLTARFDKAPALEILDIVLQDETDAEGDPGGAGGAGMGLDGFDQTAGDATAADVGIDGQPVEIDGVAFLRGEDGAADPAVILSQKQPVLLQPFAQTVDRFRQRPAFRLQLSPVLREGAMNQSDNLGEIITFRIV